ncbi:MAG: M48 family peptidase [Herbiconiux sp.]|uniref:SprT-like domain-containing protein n=1 Tax=Herbiconiux sp. TaxID=1871186 RepID=UPI00120748BA|nr:SprT-like domain-containing protein [Herbiconiux sp.]TAJ50076.1 MAG: M48 family peptidase [Herbiconiux sp.]
MAELSRVTTWANALIALHLEPAVWSFGFDNAKTRAGQCNYTAKKITVSRYLAARYDDDEIHQILLHEIAHAMAGSAAGHGPRWVAVAREIGYEGKRLHEGDRADDLAPWVGRCPAGHEYYRHRRPKARLSCSLCARGFSSSHLIVWSRRDVAAVRRESVRQAG